MYGVGEIINSPQLTILEISTSSPTRINSNHVTPVENWNISDIEASGEKSTQDADLLVDYPAYSGYFEANSSSIYLYIQYKSGFFAYRMFLLLL